MHCAPLASQQCLPLLAGADGRSRGRSPVQVANVGVSSMSIALSLLCCGSLQPIQTHTHLLHIWRWIGESGLESGLCRFIPIMIEINLEPGLAASVNEALVIVSGSGMDLSLEWN